jgi:hypothetical protein
MGSTSNWYAFRKRLQLPALQFFLLFLLAFLALVPLGENTGFPVASAVSP